MEITLRKAHKIVRELNAQIQLQRSQLETNAKVQKHHSQESVTNQLTRIQESLQKASGHIPDLICIKYQMRELIGEANQRGGVNALLSQQAALREQREFMVELIVDGKAYPNLNTQEIQAWQDREESDHFLSNGQLAVGVMGADWWAELETAADQCRRAAADLDERIQEANFTTKVNLGDDLVTELQGLGIV